MSEYALSAHGSVRATVWKYAAVLRVNCVNSLAYTSHLISRAAIVLLRIWIFTQLYSVTYAAFQTASIGGMTVPMVVWSLMLTQSFQSSTRPYSARLIEEEVKSGSIAHTLSKPYSFVLFHLSAFFGRLGPKLAVNLAVGAGAALVLAGPLQLSLKAVAAALVLLVLGLVLEFFISLCIGLLSFWVEDISAFLWVYSKGQLVFGGLVLPPALFPQSVSRLVEFLPFAQLYYAPARLAVQFSPGMFLHFFVLQAAWLAAAVCAGILLFKKGVAHVSLNGG